MNIKAGYVASALINRGAVIVMGDREVTLRRGFLTAASIERFYDVDSHSQVQVANGIWELAAQLGYSGAYNEILSLSLSRGQLAAMLYTYHDNYREARAFSRSVIEL